MKLGYQNEDLSGWKGKWIFIGYRSSLRNTYRRYRKTFSLQKKELKSATIRITAETRYLLWVNGQYVTRGPAKCYPWYQAYDTLDISAYLKPGKNSIAVLVHIIGKTTYSSIWRDKAGLLVDGEIKFKDGSGLRVDTDSSWKIIVDPARSSEGQQLMLPLSFQEIFDSRKDLPGWTLPDFDDSTWKKPDIFGKIPIGTVPAGTFPWSNMINREIPLLEEKITHFTGTTCFFRGTNDKDWQDNSKLMNHLEKEKRIKADASNIRVEMNGQILSSILVKPAGKNNFSAVVLDLGKTSVGCPRLKIKAATGGEVIDFYYATRHPDDELFMTVTQPNDAKNKKKQKVKKAPETETGHDGLTDRYICKAGEQDFETFLFKGYRYLMLVFRNVVKPLKIAEINNNFVAYPVIHKGSFECSDETFNKIWKLCENGLRICMLDSYIDCPDREQAQWMFDGLIEGETNFFSFGDKDLFRRLIRQCAQNQTPEGLLYAVFPVEHFVLIIVDFNLHWLQAADRYYYYTKDKTILAEIFPVAEKNLAWFEKLAGKEKLLKNPEGLWLWLDWSTLKKSGTSATFNLQYMRTLQAMQRICKLTGKNAAPYKKQEAAVKKALIRTFYDKKHGVWYENYNNGKLTQLSQHANALACLAGLPSGKGSLEILKQSFLKESKKKPIASAGFSFYVLESLFKLKEETKALDLIKEGWGFMLKHGATSTWETFFSLTRGTVCHGWSTHPIALLSKNVLGIKPVGPGWETFKFEPTKDLRITRAKGSVPTPYGEITAEWQRDANGKVVHSLNYPKEIRLVKK